MYTHRHTDSCAGFKELGHEHINKPTHAEEIVKAWGEREREKEGQRAGHNSEAG